MANLQILHLQGTAITDEALKELARFPKLEELQITYCKLTDVGIAEFKRARPNCTMY